MLFQHILAEEPLTVRSSLFLNVQLEGVTWQTFVAHLELILFDANEPKANTTVAQLTFSTV